MISKTVVRHFLVLTVLVAILAIAQAIPSATAGGMTPVARESSSEWQAGPKARARLIAAIRAVGELATLPVGLEVELEPGWKTYWRSPGDAGVPPGVDWTGSTNVDTPRLHWPAPERFDFFGIETFGYHDRVVFPIDVAVSEPGKPVELRARADLLVCDDICIPHTLNLALDLAAGPPAASPEANLISRFRSLVPGDGARAGLSLEAVQAGAVAPVTTLSVAVRSVEPFDKPDVIVEGPRNIVFSPPAVERSGDGTAVTLRIAARDAYDDGKPVDLADVPLTLTVVDGMRTMEARVAPARGASGPSAGIGDLPATSFSASLPAILVLALLGGLILNLMPCVLPVLAIKLLAVVGHGGGERARVRRGFLASTAGIVAAFLLLAGLAVGLKHAGLAVGWGIQFQQPLFVVAMVVILTLFACNLWGWFEIRLPGAVATAAAGAGGDAGGGRATLTGSFLQGAFATLLATPCSAPFLGTAVGFALSRGSGEIVAVFATLGVGMALPFLAVAAFPAMATRLPRPGRWMIWLKRGLAIALIATAVWLLSVLAVQESVASAAAVGLLMALAALVLALRHGTGRTFGRAAPALVAVAALLAFAAPAIVDGAGFDARDRRSTETDPKSRWQAFDRAAIAPLVASGKTVFVDVTADWCITCQVNKRRVLDADRIADVLNDDRIVRMRADWTSPDPAIADFLASYGLYGIPFDVVYGPTSPAGVTLPELLTESAVLEALAEADRSHAIAAR
jgi:suppressor for copper-sensitivity B